MDADREVGAEDRLGPGTKQILRHAELAAAHQVVTALTQQNTLEAANPTAGVTPAGYSIAQGIANIGILRGHPPSGVAGALAQQQPTPSQTGVQRAALTAPHPYLSPL